MALFGEGDDVLVDSDRKIGVPLEGYQSFDTYRPSLLRDGVVSWFVTEKLHTDQGP
ncbi:hypothetical protein VD0004_g9578 [Verticillium dahliae]|nr:hypothetical protein VD0004_g9578 [Verticillium dahliae]PNH61971.1 hypothetical protein VD0001_g9578 [Verticillium dahliae]RBQ84665.1 hypothetical protein VDGD_20885 [Verticillium dahliae]